MKYSHEKGFLLPSIIIMSAAMFVIGLAIAQLVISNQQAVVRGMYEQIAQTAAKSGVDYAKDQFLASGVYDGTGEQTAISNGKYRVTFTVSVLSTSADGLEKKIESVGRVYIPELSSSQLLLSSVKSEIIRTTTTSITPDEFSPMAWYDASDNPTVHEIDSTTANWTDLNTNNAAYLNERTSNGTQTNGSWNSAWVSFGYNSVLSSDSYTGTIFSLSGIPAGATINNAYVQFKSQGTTLSVGWIDIKALAMPAVPASGVFAAPNASNQLRGQPTVGPTVSWFNVQWPSGGQSGPSQRTPDIKGLVSATMAQPGFNPATHKIGLKFDRVLGIGNHRAVKGAASLVVNYSISGTSQAEHNDKVVTWDDKSGNGRHLKATTGNEPTYSTGQQNGRAMITFPYISGTGKSMSSDIFNLTAQAPAATIFIVGKGTSNTAAGGAMFQVDSTIPAETNCAGGQPCTKRTYLVQRSGSTANADFSVKRSGSGGSSGQTVTTPNIFTAGPSTAMLTQGIAFSPGSCNPYLDRAAIDIANNASYISSCPGNAINPKSFKDEVQVKIGTGDNGARFDGQVGEVIMYDKQLGCQQVRSVQKYLRQKWFNDPSDTNVIACPSLPIPSY